jgi:hypothetical protein
VKCEKSKTLKDKNKDWHMGGYEDKGKHSFMDIYKKGSEFL